MILTKEQISAITKRQKYKSQIAVLRSFGLEVKQLPTGEPVVAIDNFRRVFGCEPPTGKQDKPVKLNLGALQHAAA